MSNIVSDIWRTIVARWAYRCMSSSLLPQGDIKMQMQRVTLRLPEQQLKMIDMLVEYGEFPSASEAIRTAIRDLIDQRSVKLAGRMELLGKVQEQAKHAESFLRMKEEEQ
jgi:antitoxin ParD1/3/4